MRTILRANSVLGFLLAGALGLACSTENEPVGVARDAVSSDAFYIACETSPAPPSGATHGAIGLAAWTPGSSVHAARFDSNGNVLDGTPIDLGLPAPLPPFSSTSIQGGAHVLETASGFAVVIESDDCGPPECYRRLRYRTVDPSGALGTTWEVAASVESSLLAPASITYLGGGFDGSTAYVAYATDVSTAGQPNVNLYATSVETPPVASLIATSASPMSGVYYNPFFYAFGCRAGGCLSTFREATPLGPGNNKAKLLGQPAIDAPDSDVGEHLIGTPSGFLQAQVSDETVVANYSALGVPTSAKIPVWGSSVQPYISNGLVFDGNHVRAVWATATGLQSGTFSDAGVVSEPPAAETTAPDEVLGATATFGSGRTLVVLAAAAGIEGRFIGSIPASVPAGCPSPTTTSSASAGGAGGAAVSAASAGGAGGSGTSGSSDAATSATVAQSSSASGGGSGGASATTSNGPASSAAVTTGSTGAVTTGGSTTNSSGGGGDDGGIGASGGCSVGHTSPFEPSAAVWTSTLLAIVMARSARRGKASRRERSHRLRRPLRTHQTPKAPHQGAAGR